MTANEIAQKFVNYGLGAGAEKALTEEIKAYAREAIVEHLERAAENAGTRVNDESTSIIVDRDSIRNIEIRLD